MTTTSRTALAAAVLLVAAVASAETFKIATISPDGSGWMKHLRAADEEIQTATEGRVRFKFYPNGVMGDDWSALRKMRVGQLQGAVVTTAVFSNIFTDIQLYNLPMQFRSMAEVDYVRGKLDARLMQGLEDNGFVTFGLAEVGMAYAMSTQNVSTVSGAKGLKVWTPQGDVASARTIEAFEISPIPLTIADVLAGLQTSLIDTVATPPVATLALQWHTQLDYVLDLPLMYVYGLMVVSDNRFRRLSEADQAAVRAIMSRAVARADADNRRDHDAAFDVLLDQGLELVHPSVAETAVWQSYADAASARWVSEGIVSAGLFDTLNAHLEEFRAGIAH